MKKKLIYVLEDEKNIQHLIKYNLENSGFNVNCFTTSAVFFQKLNENTCDLLILDIMLPDTDGYDVLAKLKLNNKFANIPVIMLTAKKEEFDKILGLEMGADDYVTKPFSVRELISRVKAVLRRTNSPSPKEPSSLSGIIKHMDLEIHPDKHQVVKSGITA